MIACVAETFHVLPSIVARDLDADPEQLSLLCIPLLRYAEAKSAFDHAKDPETLTHWKGSAMMAAVKKNTFDFAKERAAERAAAKGKS